MKTRIVVVKNSGVWKNETIRKRVLNSMLDTGIETRVVA